MASDEADLLIKFEFMCCKEMNYGALKKRGRLYLEIRR